MSQQLGTSLSTLQLPHLAQGAAPIPPVLPSSWQCTALLHPFSPPPSDAPRPDVPFFQLCIATIAYIEGKVLSVQLTGVDYGTWWYKIFANETLLSVDRGNTWVPVNMGWTLPTTRWLSSQATFFATGSLNWMNAQQVDWWKQPVPSSNATTWIWFNNGNQSAGLPFRMMFGAPPPTPYRGDPTQLAVFQNFSFTYFPAFWPTANPAVNVWTPPNIPGFTAGNPQGFKLVVWNPCFGMTTLMTPVDSASFPLPTVVLYQWTADSQYRVATDRGQYTGMSYQYNPNAGFDTQVAQLYGVAPKSVTPPPLAGSGYIYNLKEGSATSCQNIGLGQEPPDWARIPAVQGAIHACVTNNPALCPGQVVAIIAVLFPPSAQYPQGRYLWTWYSPFPGSDGTHSRPVTFMESASTIAEGGTSLALADYYYYVEFSSPINPSDFALPAICTSAGKAAPGFSARSAASAFASTAVSRKTSR